MKTISMIKITLLLSLLFSGLLWAKTLYKVIQADGTVLYTDIPKAGAEVVDLSNTNSATMPALAVPPAVIRKNTHSSRPKPSYQLRLLTPANEQNLRSNNGLVRVTAKLQPTTAGQYLLFLNNQQVATERSGTFILENLNRGSHQIQVKFSDNSGKILASSAVQTFHLHRASLLISQN